MSSKYTKDRSVKQPAIELIQYLNLKNACDEVLGEDGSLSCKVAVPVQMLIVL